MGWLCLLYIAGAVPFGFDAIDVAGQHEGSSGTVIVWSLLAGLAALPRAAGWRATDGISRWKGGRLVPTPGPPVWDEGSVGSAALLLLANIVVLATVAFVFVRFGWPEETTWGSVWSGLCRWMAGWAG